MDYWIDVALLDSASAYGNIEQFKPLTYIHQFSMYGSLIVKASIQ